MKAVIQLVSEASVEIDSKEVRSIGTGLLIFLGVGHDDKPEDSLWLARKIANIRIFKDKENKTNLSTSDIGGDMLVVSQFTLLADLRKGNRPSLNSAASNEIAIPLYRAFISELKRVFRGRVLSGEFGASMRVSLVNDGPFTVIISSKNRYRQNRQESV